MTRFIRKLRRMESAGQTGAISAAYQQPHQRPRHMLRPVAARYCIASQKEPTTHCTSDTLPTVSTGRNGLASAANWSDHQRQPVWTIRSSRSLVGLTTRCGNGTRRPGRQAVVVRALRPHQALVERYLSVAVRRIGDIRATTLSAMSSMAVIVPFAT